MDWINTTPIGAWILGATISFDDITLGFQGNHTDKASCHVCCIYLFPYFLLIDVISNIQFFPLSEDDNI